LGWWGENFSEKFEKVKILNLSSTPDCGSDSTHAIPFNAMAGSSIDDNVEARRFPMVADLTYRSYISPTLWDTFLEDIPEVVTQEHVTDLRKKDRWKIFIASCTGGEMADPFSNKSSGYTSYKDFITRQISQA